MSVSALWLPILLSGISLFFLSFVSWMVLHLHKDDWKKAPHEDDLLAALKAANVPVGNYMVPGINHPSEMNSPEFQKKMADGPRATMSVLPPTNMGANLDLTIVFFLVQCLVVGYLASIAFKPGESFPNVFRFVFTATVLANVTATIGNSIWFRNRFVGHAIESIAYAAATGAIFAALWPK